MSRDNDTLPARGETWYNGGTIDAANLGGAHLEGSEKVFEDINWGSSAGAKPARTGQKVTCRLVRNNSGVTLHRKRLVQLDPANGGKVTGYAQSYSQYCYPVDEFLPAGGVPANDLFWIVTKGPAICLTVMVGSQQGADIAVGAVLHSGTTSTGTTASGTTGAPGRVDVFTVAAATTAGQFTDINNFHHNKIGRAMSARTTAETNSDILVDIKAFAGGN